MSATYVAFVSRRCRVVARTCREYNDWFSLTPPPDKRPATPRTRRRNRPQLLTCSLLQTIIAIGSQVPYPPDAAAPVRSTLTRGRFYAQYTLFPLPHLRQAVVPSLGEYPVMLAVVLRRNISTSVRLLRNLLRNHRGEANASQEDPLWAIWKKCGDATAAWLAVCWTFMKLSEMGNFSKPKSMLKYLFAIKRREARPQSSRHPQPQGRIRPMSFSQPLNHRAEAILETSTAT